MSDDLKLVKELRDKTGAGFLDCKEALASNDGNLDNAIDYLRKKGLAKASKKSSRDKSLIRIFPSIEALTISCSSALWKTSSEFCWNLRGENSFS